MEILWETLSFAAKGLVVVAAFIACALVVVGVSRRGRLHGPRLEVKTLNKRFESLGDTLRSVVLGRKRFRAFARARHKKAEAEPKDKPSVFVLEFTGDILASRTTQLRDEVSAILQVTQKDDEVVLRLESPGGGVPHYGLAAAQLVRLRDKGVKVTVCIDRMAASGGYMMACVAEQILAAPFAIVGSIGVVAQVPNLHRLLKEHNVDYEEMTAGEFKRTISIFGEISDKGKKKFQDQLEDTHRLFKDFVKSQRPKVDIDAVSTGEYWLARRAVELGLVDRLSTSDDYLLSRVADANLYQVTYRPAPHWRERLGGAAASIAERVTVAVLTQSEALRLR